jgi:hypothetical protein
MGAGYMARRKATRALPKQPTPEERRRAIRQSSTESLRAAAPGVALQIAVVAAAVAIPRFFGEQINTLVRPFLTTLAGHPASIPTELGLIVGALLFGTLIYAFKCRWPRWYGTIEIIIGLSVATYVLDPFLSGLSSSASVYFTAVGALYVVVRGYDNIYKSMTPGSAGTQWWNRWFFGCAETGKL